jgi:hypothetical protein
VDKATLDTLETSHVEIIGHLTETSLKVVSLDRDSCLDRDIERLMVRADFFDLGLFNYLHY